MTTVAIMQPTYLPWCGFFDLLDQADVFVLLDTVAVSRQSWQTRNRIRARNGNVVWLSVPTNATPGMPLNEVRTSGSAWKQKHWRTLHAAYSHAPHWNYVTHPLRAWLMEHSPVMPPSGLTYYTAGLTEWIERALYRLPIEQHSKTVRASTLGLPRRADPIHRIAEICAAVGATEYLSPEGARGYLDGHDLGVPIRWHDYNHPTYDQGGAEFVSHLSVVDLLAWHGPESLDIIRSGRTETA